MNKKLNCVIEQLNKQLGLLLSIGFGVFIFVLFFQPFPLEKFDFNNLLIFVSGLGAIVFIAMFLVRIAYPVIIANTLPGRNEMVMPSFISGFVILAISSVGFAFYLRYVGSVTMSFYVMFKVMAICLVPPIITRVYDLMKELKHKNEALTSEIRFMETRTTKSDGNSLNNTIEFVSENTASDNFSLNVSAVVLVKSADNYVEIIYKEDDVFKKKLLRNTLRNIEQLLSKYTTFVRCHRTYIVNMLYVDKMDKNFSNNLLVIKGFDEQIPVSRQYLLQLKASL